MSNDVINLETFSDDNAGGDDTGNLKPSPSTTPSPFGGKKKVSTTTEQQYKVIAIQSVRTHETRTGPGHPTIGLNGIILHAVNPKNEWNFVQPVYKQEEDFIAETHVLEKVFDLCMDGKPIRQKDKPQYVKRCLVWVFPQNKPEFDANDILWIFHKYFDMMVEKGYLKTKPTFDVEKHVEWTNRWGK
jgi:hypothetical protein